MTVEKDSNHDPIFELPYDAFVEAARSVSEKYEERLKVVEIEAQIATELREEANVAINQRYTIEAFNDLGQPDRSEIDILSSEYRDGDALVQSLTRREGVVTEMAEGAGNLSGVLTKLSETPAGLAVLEEIFCEYQRLLENNSEEFPAFVEEAVEAQTEGGEKEKEEVPPTTISSWSELLEGDDVVRDSQYVRRIKDIVGQVRINEEAGQVELETDEDVFRRIEELQLLSEESFRGNFSEIGERGGRALKLRSAAMTVSLITRQTRDVWIDPNDQVILDIATEILLKENPDSGTPMADFIHCKLNQVHSDEEISKMKIPTDDNEVVGLIIETLSKLSKHEDTLKWPLRDHRLAKLLGVETKLVARIHRDGLVIASKQTGGKKRQNLPAYDLKDAVQVSLVLEYLQHVKDEEGQLRLQQLSGKVRNLYVKVKRMRV